MQDQETVEQKGHILIIEDEQEVNELLNDFLNIHGYKTTVVNNGAEAWGYIKNEPPDLIITDLLLPGEHGLDLINQINNEFFIPIIIISGIYKSKEVQKSMDCGCVTAFFEKPLGLKKVLRKIEAILESHSGNG